LAKSICDAENIISGLDDAGELQTTKTPTMKTPATASAKNLLIINLPLNTIESIRRSVTVGFLFYLKTRWMTTVI
jgi:hypothetical protein